jgi:hypothetical protein
MRIGETYCEYNRLEERDLKRERSARRLEPEPKWESSGESVSHVLGFA